MTLQQIQKSIPINAPAQKVWQVLLDKTYIEEWYKAFGEGVKADTDWRLGSKATFADQKGDGMVGRIVTLEPNKKISIEYDGFLSKGQEDLVSEAALSIKGTQETYILEKNGNVTTLSISLEMDENYFGMMSAMWDNALQKIKELSETGTVNS